MSKYKVLVTDYTYNTLEPEREILEKVGATLITAQCSTEDEVIEAAQGVDGIMNQYAPISRKVIDTLPNCRVISRYGVGFDTIDLNAATERGIMVCNVTDYCIDEVSNHAFALLIAGARKIVKHNKEVKSGNWDYKLGGPVFRLNGRTLGLIGLGNIPKALAKKAQAFGLKVIAYDPYVHVETAEAINVDLVDLETLCQESDYLSVHAPLNNNTIGMVSDAEFNLMKTEAFIINTSRGLVIDESALIKALQAGKIAGAGLDVLETEPLSSNNPLIKMDNVFLSPHSAYYSIESELELKRKTAQNIADALIGKIPKYLVNKGVCKNNQSTF
ncbi:C-terminal binding protein [Metabacillus litoralis]|uniref:Hydroxyacid dehydrogenase n=1 Tax=Metabacillus litoralis TaxID=152268 RepID=A0A179SPB9_9BACI|nr:C-terminal binding protein [Metabacillus litoralis]OAS82779.1 hydroxyacid dehydrogenase [Metabacillus litoralis]